MKTKTPLHRIATLFALALLATFGATHETKAQYQITTLGGSITENFTSYAGTAAPSTSGTNGWVINSSNTLSFQGNGNGSSGTGGVWSYGVNGNTDRGLGFLGSGTAGANMNAFAEVQNNISSGTVTSLVVSWSGEMWRRISTATSAITVAYAIGTQGITSAATLGGLSWTNLNTYTPTMGANANGSLLNSQNFNSGSVNLAGFNNTQSIYIRVYYLGGGGTRAGLAIDDLSVTFNGAPPAGDNLYWTANGSALGGTGNWTTAGSNWSPDATTVAGAAWDGSKTAIFAGTAGTVSVQGGGITASAGLTFSNTGYEIAGGALTLGGANIASNTITTDASVTATISSQLSGTAGMTKAGAGDLILSGANAYTGGTVVSAGRLIGTTGSLPGNITNNAAVTFNQNADGTYSGAMSGSGSLTKSGTGTVTLSGANTYGGGTLVSAGRLVGTTTSLQGSITNNAAVTFDQNTDGTYAGLMSGTGSLVKAGTGTATLSGANTYTGGTLVSGGRLVGTTTSLQGAITNNAAVTFNQSTNGTYSGAMTGSGSLVKSGAGVVTLSGANSYSGGTLVSAGDLVGTTTSLQGAITNNAAVTFDQNTTGTYSGAMSGSGSLTKTGSGEVTLSGNSSFSGGMSIDGGAVVAANNNALGTGAVTLNSGSLLATDNATIGNDLVIAETIYGGFIISEYVEGSSNNKYIELYNGTGADITLGDFRVALFANGAGAGSPTSTQTLSLVGAGATLAHGQTLVLRNSGAALTLPPGVTSYTSGVVNFNGNDALALQSLDGSVNYDIFGVIGNDPGTAWTAGSLSTLDQTLTRDSDVLFGVTVNPSGTGAGAFTTLGTEWTGSPINTVSNLGSHTMNFQTGGGTIGSDIASASVTYSGSVTLAGAAVLTAATGGNTTFSGIVSGAGTLNKTGAGTVTLSGASANTFTGMTTVGAGTLQLNKATDTDAIAGDLTIQSGATLLLSASGNVADTSVVTLSGGTITRGAGVSEIFGDLNIAGGSILNFGTGAVGDLQFQEYSYTGSSLVVVQNFLPGNRLQFLGTSFGEAQLADFNFGSFGFTSGLEGDYFTITAIPEPSTYLAAAGLLSLMLWPSRKRIIRDAKKIFGFTPPMRDRLAAKRISFE